MKPLTMLATPDGKWVFPNSAEFFAALGDSDPDYDAIAFAVKNLGFVKFQVLEQSITEIDLHPHTVELPALLAVQQQILTSPTRLFLIKYFDSDWRSEISSTVEHTIERLSELCAPVCTPPTNDKFVVVEVKDFSDLFDDEYSQLRPLGQKWRASFGHFDPSVISLALRQELLSRMVIVGVKPREQEPRWRFIGDGHKWMGDYQIEGIGQPVATMPDQEYGGWVAEFYKSVAASGQPRLDVTTALLRYEDDPGRPRRPICYERLMLPWKTPSDEIFVTLCSRLVSTEFEWDSPASIPTSSASMNLAKSS